MSIALAIGIFVFAIVKMLTPSEGSPRKEGTESFDFSVLARNKAVAPCMCLMCTNTRELEKPVTHEGIMIGNDNKILARIPKQS